MEYRRKHMGPAAVELTAWEDGGPVTVAQWQDRLATEPSARRHFHETLASVPFEAFCWEVAPLTALRFNQPFECVVVDSPELQDRRVDPSPFAGPFARAHAQDAEARVAVFANLGGDATLISPLPDGELPDFPHLATFVRTAPASIADALWKRVGEELRDQLGPEPVWLSTAGLGVSWLHVRLDTEPKYYRHQEYRSLPP